MESILSPTELQILQSITVETPRQVVWDINALYFVYAAYAIKVEADGEVPHPEHRDEEVVCLRVEKLDPPPHFAPLGEPEHWYRVMCENTPVDRLELVQAAVEIPGERVVPRTGGGAFPADVGLFVYTGLGVIPAVQLENVFGFHNWIGAPKWFPPEQALSTLPSEYSLVVLAG
jgi:hypothetical protein